MAYPSKNSTTYTSPTKNVSTFALGQQQATHTWENELMTWAAELRTWAEVMTWSYQSKN
jgi:hypothetical protein